MTQHSVAASAKLNKILFSVGSHTGGKICVAGRVFVYKEEAQNVFLKQINLNCYGIIVACLDGTTALCLFERRPQYISTDARTAIIQSHLQLSRSRVQGLAQYPGHAAWWFWVLNKWTHVSTSKLIISLVGLRSSTICPCCA